MGSVQTIYASCDREVAKPMNHRDDERLGAEFSRYSPVLFWIAFSQARQCRGCRGCRSRCSPVTPGMCISFVASVSLANQFPSESTRLLETHPRLAFPLFHLLLASRRVGVRPPFPIFFADIMLSTC